MSFFEELLKLLNSKNIAFVVLLLITFGSGYLVFSFTSTILQDNKIFIEKLEKIHEILKNHEEKHEISSKTKQYRQRR